MASLSMSSPSKAVKGRTRKPIPNVDLTAMVDLAFLLITFFMLTTSLRKESAMELAKPDPGEDVSQKTVYPASRTLTILLAKDNKAVYYLGEVTPSAMRIVDISAVREVILNVRDKIFHAHKNTDDKSMYIIVKPTNKAVYKNFIDIMDEIAINKIVGYAIDDKYILEEEINFLQAKGI